MNSVIQQLYMIPPIRNGILAIEGTGTDVDDDMSGDEKQENEVQQLLVLEKNVWYLAATIWLIHNTFVSLLRYFVLIPML